MSRSTSARIGKLFAMLTSPADAEVAAAARHLVAAINAAGLDVHRVGGIVGTVVEMQATDPATLVFVERSFLWQEAADARAADRAAQNRRDDADQQRVLRHALAIIRDLPERWAPGATVTDAESCALRRAAHLARSLGLRHGMVDPEVRHLYEAAAGREPLRVSVVDAILSELHDLVRADDAQRRERAREKGRERRAARRAASS